MFETAHLSFLFSAYLKLSSKYKWYTNKNYCSLLTTLRRIKIANIPIFDLEVIVTGRHSWIPETKLASIIVFF